MMNNEIKLPAAYAAIDENEMVYLNGGSITDTQGWLIFMNVGSLFNYIARVFSAGSSIINNVRVIVTTIEALNTFKLTGKNTKFPEMSEKRIRKKADALFCAESGENRAFRRRKSMIYFTKTVAKIEERCYNQS